MIVKVAPPTPPPLGAALGVALAAATPLPPLDVKSIFAFVTLMRGQTQNFQLVLAELSEAERQQLAGGRLLLNAPTENNVNTVLRGFNELLYTVLIDVDDRERRYAECNVLRMLEDNFEAMRQITSDTRLVKEEQLARETNGFVNSIIELAAAGGPAALASATAVQSLKDRQVVVKETLKRQADKNTTTKVDSASAALMQENLAMKAEMLQLRAQLDAVTRGALAASTTPPVIASDRRTDKR